MMSPRKVKVPKAKVLKACISMRGMGIPEEHVKPVLDDLANIYNNNWALIEDENYRVLVDAIFERQEVKVHSFVLCLLVLYSLYQSGFYFIFQRYLYLLYISDNLIFFSLNLRF